VATATTPIFSLYHQSLLMATGYKALLALGESHTKSVESTVQAALAEKKRKEQQRRKQQEEQEQKQRELETKLRLRYFEEQKKKEEAEARKAEELKAKEADLLRREAAQRDALRYGPKKAKTAAASGKWPTSGSGIRDEVRRKRLPDDEDEEVDTGNMLTREEKRERKLQAELKRAFHAPRRTGHVTTGSRKVGRRLPGGAYDVPTTPSDTIAATSGPGNVKDRLSALPNTLTRLNVVKRDTRTIDEIVRDRRENKEVLDGDRARNFDDWFTPSSRTQPKTAPVASSSASDEGSSSTRVQPKKEKFSSSPSSSSSRLPSQSTAPRRTPAPTVTPKSKLKAPVPAPLSSVRKRPRSLSASRSVSPPPKRSHLATGSSKVSSAKAKSASSRSHSPRAGPSVKDEIWELFGKNRSAYVGRDVLSDSEDDDAAMEAGASALEHEEKISERIARKEEREAEMEERRHEEEKRRRKAAMAAR
jgi:protein SPT2